MRPIKAKSLQRTPTESDAAGTCQGQPHIGARNRYNAERAHPPATVGASGRHHEPGSQPGSMCPAHAPSESGGVSPRVGARSTASGRPTGALRASSPDKSGAPARGHQARQRGR